MSSAGCGSRRPAFRPALFYSPYEAAVWSILSARRARRQVIPVRERLAVEHGTTLRARRPDGGGPADPDPAARRGGAAGLPADRIPRLHADRRGRPTRRTLGRAAGGPGSGRSHGGGAGAAGDRPFSSALIVVRACGLTDVLPDEPHVREATASRLRSHLDRRRIRRAGRGLASVPDLGGGAAAGDRRTRPSSGRLGRCRRETRSGDPAGDCTRSWPDSALTTSEFRVPTLATTELAGVAVLEVVSRGKHQLFRFDNDYTLHTHFRMDGTWRTFPRGRRWSGGEPFQIRAVLRTATHDAVGYRLPVVELLPTAEEDTVVGHLGPDLLGPDWDSRRGAPPDPGRPGPDRRGGAARPAQPGGDRHLLPRRGAVPPGSASRARRWRMCPICPGWCSGLGN